MNEFEAPLTSEELKHLTDKAHELRALEIKRLLNVCYSNINVMCRNVWSKKQNFNPSVFLAKST
ncbi:MAG: hypothetical protein AAF402_09825 [Pseudomonadota bacterium]